MTPRSVTSTDGTTLAARVGGAADGPPVVLVHGFPDSSQLWDAVVERLAPTHRVVTYDVRGTGASAAPGGRAGYRFAQLADDLVAVAEATCPGTPVHVVGHDWGAIQAFEAVCSPTHAQRLASFTCVSGASFDHAGWALRRSLRAGPAGWADVLGQLRRSWYMAAFQLPVLPEALLRSRLGRRVAGRLEPGAAGERSLPTTYPRDAANGVNLYRANLGRLARPRRGQVLVPVQVVVGTHDPFLSDAVYDELPAFADEAWLRHVDGGHWLPRTHPDEVADAVRELVAHVEGDVPSPGLQATRLTP